MADYELPPLRIKIVGDGKDFRKATDAVIKEAQRLEAELNKKVGNVSPVIVAKSAAIAMNSVFKAIATHALAMSASVKIGSNIGARELSKAYKDVTRKFITNVSTHVSTLANSLKPSKSGSWALGKAVRTAQSAVLTNLLAGITTVAASSGTLGKTTAQLSNAIRLGINKILRALAKAVRAAVDMAVQKIDVNKFAKNLQKAIERGINKARINTSKVNLSTRNRGSGGSVGGSYGDRGNSFLGDRADIYMHINAVRNFAAVWRSPLNALVEYQNKIATLAPQMGGMANAETFVRGMRNTQVGQTYGSEIATTATRLKPHMGEQEMQRMMEAVGDISGGDSERFKGLSRALGDVLSTGHLQGDELRQFQEQQFPLMDLLAKRTGKTTMELYKMMEKRQIPAKAIVELMKAETSQGGKYAGFLDSLSQTLGSAVQRVKTFYEALQVDVMKTVADQLVKYVNKLASGLVHITKWVNENQDLIKSYVELALKVSAAVVIFHAVGFAVAMVSWQMHALRRIMSILVVFTAIYNGVMRILTGTYWLLRVAVMATVASMFICRSVMAGLVATSAAISAGIGFLTAAVWTYTTTTRLATIATQIFAMTVGRSAIMSRVAALFALVFNGALNTIRATLAALRIGVVLTWLAFLWPVAAVIAAVLAIVGVINIAINSLGPAGFTGAIYGAWDSMKKFAINAIGFFMNIGHNSQVVAKYIYDNFWNMVQDTGTILGRLFANWASDSMLTFDTVAKLFGALMGWLVVNAPTWGYNIVNGLWTGFTWLFNKIKTGFAMVWEYATTGKLSEDFTNHLAGVGEAALKGATEGFLPAAAGIIAEHQKNSALLNNWGGMDLKSPAMEGLKFDWKTVDMLGLADKIPDIDFGAGAIPGMPNIDWSKLFGGQGGSDTKAGETATTPTTPMAVRAGSADHLDRVDAAMMAMGDPTAKTNAQIATNTGETNVILKQIQQSLVKPGSWSMKAEPAL